ncbi:methyl-accepting chemotaxis protein [Enhygromyxa salina]|uniref:methyl-accepting chemotaxis protein n=1 Tax=Enhygromyxa salina TaxID=215803 RepID=UPI0011B298DE|nr:methyl-accepting chemotaxis protein [Enhygromyxa salina]
MSRRNVFIPTLARVIALDTVGTAIFVVLWAVTDVVGVGLALGLTAARVGVWIAHLRALLGPVRAWRLAGDDAGDTQVLEADRALDRLPRLFLPAYLIGWVAVFGLGALLNGSTEAIGHAELLASGLSALALVMMTPILLGPLFRVSLLDPRLELGEVLLERGLDGSRSPSSVGGSAMARAVTLVVGTILGVGGFGGLARAQALRDAELNEQLRRAELSALRIEAGLGQALDGVALVGPDELPELVRDELEPGNEAAPIFAYDSARRLAVAAAPTGDGRWAVAEARPDEQLDSLLLGLLVLVLAVAPPIAFLGWIHGRSLSGPIERFHGAARRLVEAGELRALGRVVPLHNDELGRFAIVFNRMLDMLEELARTAQAVAEGDLSVELDHPGELHDAFRGMLARLHEMVVRIRETALELASAAAEIHAITQQQEQAAEQQSASVQQVSATVGSLAESAEQITQTASRVLDNAEQTLMTTDAMVAKIGELSGEAASVGDLLEVIREVAKRSDLLALNGSLEATRAGEAGRGFALVAAEMRRLAERVTGTVADVRDRVTDIKASGTSTVMATEDSRKLAQSTAEAARVISTVTQQQSDDTEQVSLSVQELAEMVVAAALATSQTRSAAEGLRAYALELERLTGAFVIRGDLPDAVEQDQE